MKAINYNCGLAIILSPVVALALVLSVSPGASAQDLWTGAGASTNAFWMNGANWSGTNTPPLPGDSLFFDTSVTANTNNFPAGTPFDGLTINSTAGMFNLAGNSILLSGQTNGITLGVADYAGQSEVIGLNLGLDWGFYTFDNLGSGLNLNGTMTPNPGGVAYFGANNVASTSLTTDSAGLIAGLGGAGLMYSLNGSTAIPSGLATVSGGVISAYTYAGGNILASGNIPSGAANNLDLTATGAATIYSNTVGAGNIFANTIKVDQAGGANNSDVTTILTNASGATLVLGTNNAGAGPYIGGIYVLNPQGTNHADFTLNGGHLTAGPMSGPATPGTLVFAVNGGNSGSQAQINSVITNNGSGGAVTVVSAGTGWADLSTANTYTGGTYIAQGQLQLANVAAAGPGPVYVAGGASVYTTAGGTYANNFYLSPGTGSATSDAAATGGALAWDANETFSGTITLMGAPVTTGAGDRISANFSSGDTLTITGQITGTGTLNIAGAHTANYVIANTNTSTPNNWQGGLIVNAKGSVNVYFKMGANNQMPNGPNAGNVTLIPPGGAIYARLDLNGYNATINGLFASVNGGYAQLGNFGSANSILTLGANDATASFSGSSTNTLGGVTLSLVKIGAGTQTFTGTLSHSGNTTVSNGVFQLEALMPNSATIIVTPAGTFDASQGPNGGFTVGSNQTLTGTGMVLGSTTVNGAIAAIMAVSGAATNIGTLTNNAEGGALTLNGGATNVWYINNAAGAAGAASGWSLVDITNGQLAIVASVASPIHIKIVSLAANGLPGNAAFNPNNNQSWTLIQSPSPISGFTGSQQFAIDTSAFGNLPAGGSQFSVGTNASGNNLILYFTSTPVITSALVNQTNVAGSTAVFTVSAAGATPITYQWLQGGTTVLASGGTSASGGAVTITTNGAGTSSTLTIANVQDADGGAITVNVTNSAGGSGNSTATLIIIDAPTSPYITQTGAQTISAGGVTYLTVATSSGTAPFDYVWSYNGSVISGATNATLAVDVSPATVGSYSVVVSNLAGSVTNSPFVIGPVTEVPNQLIYEPFTSYAPMSGPGAPSVTWAGVTNLFNQLTGDPAYWQHESGNRISMVIQANEFADFTVNNAPGYPWPGLAGNSDQDMVMEVSSSETDNDQLYFWSHGISPGQSLYFSFILNCDSLGTANASDCIAAFCDSSSSTSFNLKLSTQIQTDGTYWLGLSKASGATGNQGVDADTLWVTNFQADQDVFVVGLYQANSGLVSSNDDTVSMWFDPTNSSFGTTNIPTPTLGPSTFGAANSGIHAFEVHGVQLPGNRYFSDLRIGTTWASVTPMSAPNLTLTNVAIAPGANATLTSQNAGNPVATYKWYFKDTNGAALTDGPNPTGDGSIITNSGTSALTIIGPTAADLGTYTVVGSNTDPVSGDILTGSASATLSFLAPPLNVVYTAPDAVISWPANWTAAGFSLEQTGNLASAWTAVPTNSYGLSGTNSTYTVNVPSGSLFFRLVGP